jgi:hypothetical protein
MSTCESLGVPLPEFFDPITGENRDRVQDIRGDDQYCMTSDGGKFTAMTLYQAPVILEDLRRKFIDAEEARREIYGKYRDFRDALRTLVDTCKYCELLTVHDALTEAEALLNEHGIETWDGGE